VREQVAKPRLGFRLRESTHVSQYLVGHALIDGRRRVKEDIRSLDVSPEIVVERRCRDAERLVERRRDGIAPSGQRREPHERCEAIALPDHRVVDERPGLGIKERPAVALVVGGRVVSDREQFGQRHLTLSQQRHVPGNQLTEVGLVATDELERAEVLRVPFVKPWRQVGIDPIHQKVRELVIHRLEVGPAAVGRQRDVVDLASTEVVPAESHALAVEERNERLE
jgi:hypothetical protein